MDEKLFHHLLPFALVLLQYVPCLAAVCFGTVSLAVESAAICALIKWENIHRAVDTYNGVGIEARLEKG